MDVPSDRGMSRIYQKPNLPAPEADSPSETIAFVLSPGRVDAKTGSCPRLVRRTINGRIGIQEISDQQTFDAIIGVTIF